jgi:hypothetical protein
MSGIIKDASPCITIIAPPVLTIGHTTTKAQNELE